MNTINTNPTTSTLASSISAALAQNTEGTVPPSGVAAHAVIAGLNAKIATTFLTESSDRVFVGSSARIIDLLTGNTWFPDTSPRLDVVIATRDAYVTAVNALDRSKASIAVRDQTRAALVQVLRDLALYLQKASGGDRVKLISTGFPLHKTRRPLVGLPATPANVRLRRTRVSTQLIAYCSPVASARSYQWRFASAQAPTVWTQVDPITRTRFVLEDLVPGTAYIVQVRAFSTAGAGNWSDVATMIAA